MNYSLFLKSACSKLRLFARFLPLLILSQLAQAEVAISFGPTDNYVSADTNFSLLSTSSSGEALKPFSDTIPMSPNSGYSGPAFFGGHVWTTSSDTRNFTRQQIRNDNTPEPKTDQIYYQVASPSVNWDGAILSFATAIVFPQSEYLNGLGVNPLKLKSLSARTTAFFMGESQSTPELRFLVQVNGSYYLSETSFDFNIGELNATLDTATLALENWSLYDPFANIHFDQEKALFEPLDLNAVTAVGVFMENDGWAGNPEKVAQFGVGVIAFEATGTSSDTDPDPDPSEELSLIAYGPSDSYVSGDVTLNRLASASAGVAITPFSDTELLSPTADYSGPPFFGGYEWTTTAETRSFTRQEIRHSFRPEPLVDQIYWLVASSSANWDGATLGLAGAVVFDKADFLGEAPEGIVALNRLSAQTTAFFQGEGLPEGRFLVRVGDNYFVSEQVFDIGNDDLSLSLDLTVDPAPSWAPYDPFGSLNFDAAGASFGELDLSDVTGVGLYFENDAWAGNPTTSAQFGFGVRAFEARGTVTEDTSEDPIDLWAEAQVHGQWRFLENFGWFSEVGEGWIYHYNHGFLFPTGKSLDSLFLYDWEQSAWLWTSISMHPWFYWFEPFNSWTYFREGTFGDDRLFFHSNFNEWRRVGDFSRPSSAIYHEITPPWVNRVTRVGPSQLLVNIVDGTLTTGFWDDAAMRREAPVFTPNAFTFMSPEWIVSSDRPPLSGEATAHFSFPEQSQRNAPRLALRRFVLISADRPFAEGETVTVRPATGGIPLKVKIDPHTKSDLVQVPHHGWSPESGDKHALVGGWFSPGVAADPWLSEDLRFSIVHDEDGSPMEGWAFSDGHTLRRTRRASETQITSGSGQNNWQTQHDVYIADFSDLRTEGRYRVLVEDLGSSYPFTISPDVHLPLVRHLARGFIHLQHGDDRRAEAVHPALVIPPTMRHMEFLPAKRTFAGISPDGIGNLGKLWEPQPIELEDDPQLAAFGVDHPTEGWRDAADYDIRPQHLEVAIEMLLLAMRFPRLEELDLGRAEHGEPFDKTIRGQRIQGSVPLSDITHTALYAGDAWTRMQVDTEGFWKDSVRGGFEMRGYIGGNTDFQSFATRFKDIDKAYLLRPDPWSTFAYAGFAATAAIKMDIDGDQTMKDFYAQRARKAWDWAIANENRFDLEGWNPEWRSNFQFLDAKANAAVAMWGLTGEDVYHSVWDLISNNTQPIRGSGARATSARAYLIFHQIGYREGRSNRLITIRGNVISAYQSTRDIANAGSSNSIFNRPLGTQGNGEYGFSIIHPYATWNNYLPILLLLDDPATGFGPEVRENLRTWVEADLSYATGRNPIGKSFITGFGFDSPRAIHHNDLQGTNLTVAFPGIIPFGLMAKSRLASITSSAGYDPAPENMPYHYRVVFGPGIHPNQGEFTPQNTQLQILAAAVSADALAQP